MWAGLRQMYEAVGRHGAQALALTCMETAYQLVRRAVGCTGSDGVWDVLGVRRAVGCTCLQCAGSAEGCTRRCGVSTALATWGA